MQLYQSPQFGDSFFEACEHTFMWIRIALSIGITLSFCELACALPAGVGSLIWSDEFAGDELDLTMWFHRASGPRFDGNLTPAAMSVADGLLTLKTFTEKDDHGVDKHYSGMIGNYLFNPAFGVGGVNGFNDAFGYFEVRGRFHTTSGTAAAFWLQSATIAQPIGNPGVAGVEMDIFEHRVHIGNPAEAALYPGVNTNTNVTNRINQALIWDGYGPEQQIRRQLSSTLPGLGNESWHTFGLRWTPTSDSLQNYTFYYDGVPIWNGAGAPLSEADQYVILSSEVFAAFAGPIPAGGYGARGDFDNSGVVDGGDFLMWQRTLGQMTGRGSGADASTDGVVGPEDLDIWKANFGRTASTTNVQFDYLRIYGLTAAASIPEPTGLALVAMSAGLLARRRPRTCTL